MLLHLETEQHLKAVGASSDDNNCLIDSLLTALATHKVVPAPQNDRRELRNRIRLLRVKLMGT